MIGVLLIFIFTMYENLFYKNNNSSSSKLFDYSIIFLIAGISYLIVGFIYSMIKEISLTFEFLYDYRFWLFLGVELIGMFTLNLNYINNPKNHTGINVGVFSTVLLTPVLVYILDPLLGFTNTLQVSLFNSPLNISIYILVYLIIGALFFVPKIKSKEVNKPYLIVVTSISLLLAFYIEIKLLQTYEFNILIYGVFDIFLAFIYFMSSKKSEKEIVKKIKKKHLSLGLIYSLYGILHFIGLTLIAAEIAVLSRRVSQILAGIITDKKRQNIRDIVLISLMVMGGLVLIYF